MSAQPPVDLLKVPLTADLIRDLLRGGVFVGDTLLPPPSDWRILALAGYCQRLRQIVQGRNGPWRDEEIERGKVIEAIHFLSAALPLSRAAYVEDIKTGEEMSARYPDLAEQGDEYAESARDDLAALDGLIEALDNAMHRGLPKTDNLNHLAPRIEDRTDFDMNLKRQFLTVFPGQSDFTVYRFIVAVAPYITGKPTNIDAVRKNISRLGKNS
jgi:hypothetical protein